MVHEAAKTGAVFDIQRFCIHDGPGIRTTIFLKGCNMRCPWCHNPESFSHSASDGQQKTVDQMMTEIMKDEKYYRSSGGGVTFSGGEPTMQFPFLLGLLTACRKQGLHTALETNGLFPANYLPDLLREVDLFLFDVKHTDEAEHRLWTGVSNKEIMKNLSAICENGGEVILRCPIIPGVNDNDAHFEALSALRGKYGCIREIELMPYHNTGRDKWEKQGLLYAFLDLPTATVGQKRLWQERLEYFMPS